MIKVKSSKDVGIAIRNRRKSLNIRQAQVALTCGTGKRFIGDLERGKKTCQLQKAFDILNGLGLSVYISE